MKPPVIQRFQKQQYPGAPDWFTRFIADLNQFTEVMWNIMNNNITPFDNLDAQVYTFTVLAGATAADNAQSFELNMNHSPTQMSVAQVTDTQAYAAPLTSAVGVQWKLTGSTVNITGISGLVPAQTYQITVILI